MATSYSPKTITSGLVTLLDVANIKSFRGEPTTNIFPRTPTELIFTWAFDGSSYGFGSATNIQQVIDNSLKTDSQTSITKVSRINSDVSQRTYVYIGLSSPLNTTRFVSFWYYGTYGTTIQPYNNDSSATISYLDSNGNWVGTGTAVNVPVGTNQWQKIILRITNRGVSSGTGWTWLILHSNILTVSLSNSEYWAFCEVLFEEKATPSYFYTSGTRGSTVETGGGLFDMTYNSKNGQLFGTTYDTNNLGSLNFDGSDDYYSLPQPNITTSPNQWTISLWMNPGNQSSRFLTPQSNGIDQYLTYDSVNQRVQITVVTSADTNERVRSMSSNTVLRDKWTFLTISLDNLTIKMYSNGVLRNTFTETLSIGNWSGSWVVGQRGNATFYYLGKMSNLMVHNRALTDTEVLQNYNSTKSRYGL